MASVASVPTPAYMLPGVSIVHPPHLEGDPALATEILPGPPPLSSVQQIFLKKDVKKPLATTSYLPTSDPGSTYGGLAMPGVLAVTNNGDGPRRKRARTEKSAATRAQRATNRSLNAARGTASSPIPPDEPQIFSSHSADPTDLELSPFSGEAETPALSRNNSDNALDVTETISAAQDKSKGGRNRGKGKEKEKPAVRVKDEPIPISLPLFDPATRLGNEDHCSSCRTVASGGGLVYCDSCPRAFHFMCLDPPVDPKEMGDGDWYCPCCTIRKQSPTRYPKTFMGPLLQQLESMYPMEYQLPEDIRGFYKDVATDARGAYVDTSKIKQPRLDRSGRAEEPELYRLKDRNGLPMVCFHCGKSALSTPDPSTAPAKRPRRAAAIKSVNSESGQSIISCDYCDLHWHLDCIDPPMSALPSFGKKWMCPAHADQVTLSKRRIPKQLSTPIDITQPGRRNNGNIDIIPVDQAPVEKLEMDDVVINGRRYRIPERVITLDFWSKLSRARANDDLLENMSNTSSLTSLSSDGEDDIVTPEPCLDTNASRRDAELLLSFARGLSPAVAHVDHQPILKRLTSTAIQTNDQEGPVRLVNGVTATRPISRSEDRHKPPIRQNVSKSTDPEVVTITLPALSASSSDTTASASINGTLSSSDSLSPRLLFRNNKLVPTPKIPPINDITTPVTPRPKVSSAPSTPPLAASSLTPTVPTVNGNAPSSSLKIRLPRMGGPTPSASTAESVSSNTKPPSTLTQLGSSGSRQIQRSRRRLDRHHGNRKTGTTGGMLTSSTPFLSMNTETSR